MKKPSPENFSLSNSQVRRFHKTDMGLRYGYIASIAFLIFTALVAGLAKGWIGFIFGIIIGICAAFCILAFGVSLGEDLHALFSPSYERFLEYRAALNRYNAFNRTFN